jgi:hypothetical protein
MTDRICSLSQHFIKTDPPKKKASAAKVGTPFKSEAESKRFRIPSKRSYSDQDDELRADLLLLTVSPHAERT